uniref:DNA-directed RNA polymerase n=1 Tax=viral metagenome TaxID=1070528 RepID=A0A6C0JJN5_9ZZZZ
MDPNEDFDEPEIDESDAESEAEDVPSEKKGKGVAIDAASDGEDGNSDAEEEDDAESEVEEEDDASAGNEEAIAGIGRPFAEFDNFSEDEEEDDDETYLQKFDSLSQQKIIADFHPELQSHNYDEVEILSRVVRDENGNIIDPLHKTLPFITKYEKARIIGERAKQINGGAKPFVEVDVSVIDGYLIALKEFEEKVIPFIIQRPIPSGGSEYWRFSDLEILA